MANPRIGCAFPWCHQPRSDRLRAPLCPDHARAVYLEVKDMVDNATVMERIASARESKTTKRPHYSPGTLQTEKAMQARFGPSWSHGEYFQPTPEILAFIAERAA